jgi:hypothetical protein
MDKLIVPCTMPNGEKRSNKNSVLYPEKELSIKEQQAFNNEDYLTESEEDIYIITNSPFIVSCFQSSEVYIYGSNGNSFSHPDNEVYGASFDTILTSLVGLNVLIAEKPLMEIKSILKGHDIEGNSPEDTLKNLDKFGNSFELNCRRNELRSKIN